MKTVFKSPTDFRRSLETRLKNLAKATNQDLQRLRRKVAFDRLLARIFRENQNTSFLLKGGYAMELRYEKARVTKDLDLTCLERFENLERQEISKKIFQELRDISQVDLQDFFSYQIGEARLDLENAPYGGARYSVASLLDGRLFVRFQMDIGLDIMVNKLERIKGYDWLDHYDIESPWMRMITKEQQFAEKIHAYTLPREDRINTRVKDLVDLLLLLEESQLDSEACKEALHMVFRIRGTHQLPDKLPTPPDQWENLFQKMAMECGINPSVMDAYAKVDHFFQSRIVQNHPEVVS